MEEFELEPGEHVIVEVRKHWLVFAVQLLPYVILAVVPLFIPLLDSILAHATPATGMLLEHAPDLSAPWVRFALGLWWLLLWVGGFNTFTRYFLDVWVITSERIVDIHQLGFFRRQVSSFLLAHIQDVTTDVNGVLPTLFGFGTIHVETAGHDERFIMSGLKDPEGMRDLIMREVALLHTAGQGAGV